jgi:hypothetical protein
MENQMHEVIFMGLRRNSVWIVVISMLVLALTLSNCGKGPREGCDSEVTTSKDGIQSTLVTPLFIVTPQDPFSVEALWQEGPHADTFVVAEDNTNNSCTQCHSPMNWNPTSENQPVKWTASQIDISPPTPLIDEVEWNNVSCNVCHPGEKDQIRGEFAWLENAPTDEYSEVDSSTVLCQKCHLAGEVEGHHSLDVEGSHSEFLCTDCHDAHSTAATCSSAGCHEPFTAECESIETHDKPHAEVTCSACHDNGEPQIKWNEEFQAWDTFRLSSRGNPVEYEPYTSHNLTLEVDCDRCHAPGDHPWDP